MAQIISNVFQINEEDINPSEKDQLEITKLDVNIDLIKDYQNVGNALLKEARTILNSCKGYENVTFEEIVLTKNNFQDNHYNLMNNRYLIVIYDTKQNCYKYLTPTGKVYITSDNNLISIIHNVPKPLKITCSYVPLQGDEKIFSLALFSRVLYNIYTEEPSSLIKNYIKPTVTINNENEYTTLYYLFNIYPKLEHLLNTRKYFKYIHLEQSIYNISKKALLCQQLNTETLALAKSNYIKELSLMLKDTCMDMTAIKSKTDLLQYINTNPDLGLYPTLNKKILSLLKYNDLITILKDIESIALIDYIDTHKTLPEIKTVSKYGDISEGLPIPFNLTNRILIRGYYSDMFFKILADITYKKSYIEVCKNEPLIYGLIKDKINEMSTLYACYIEYYVQALSTGCSTDNDILSYFEKELFTLLSLEDLQTIKQLYNNELSDLKDTIDNYNLRQYCNYSPKLLNNQELDPLSISIYDKKRFIMKHLIKEIDLYCTAFNERNKYKIDIMYFDSDNIYLLADEEALNIAFDTLTRVMPDTFSKYCPRVSPTCHVEIIDKKFN